MDLRLARRDQARLDFVEGLKVYVGGAVVPALRRAHDAWVERTGTEPETLRERKVMAAHLEPDPLYQSSRGLQRLSQEAMWQEVIRGLEPQRETLEATLDSPPEGLGSLTLDPDLSLPRYYTENEFHLQPGSFWNRSIAGPVYEVGVATYTMHRYGKASDEMGRALLTVLPAKAYRRILYMGCGPAYKAYPVCDAFPDAEVHGIDLAAPMLKFAHVRAREHGKAIHFHQMNAEAMTFPDGHFDLVFCKLLFHEMPEAAIRNCVASAARVLAPGGVLANLELPSYARLDPLSAYLMDWDTRHNGEPFWRAYHELDLESVYADAGLRPETRDAHSEWGGAKGNYMGKFAYQVTLGHKD